MTSLCAPATLIGADLNLALQQLLEVVRVGGLKGGSATCTQTHKAFLCPAGACSGRPGSVCSAGTPGRAWRKSAAPIQMWTCRLLWVLRWWLWLLRAATVPTRSSRPTAGEAGEPSRLLLAMLDSSTRAVDHACFMRQTDRTRACVMHKIAGHRLLTLLAGGAAWQRPSPWSTPWRCCWPARRIGRAAHSRLWWRRCSKVNLIVQDLPRRQKLLLVCNRVRSMRQAGVACRVLCRLPVALTAAAHAFLGVLMDHGQGADTEPTACRVCRRHCTGRKHTRLGRVKCGLSNLSAWDCTQFSR